MLYYAFPQEPTRGNNTIYCYKSKSLVNTQKSPQTVTQLIEFSWGFKISRITPVYKIDPLLYYITYFISRFRKIIYDSTTTPQSSFHPIETVQIFEGIHVVTQMLVSLSHLRLFQCLIIKQKFS